MKPTVSAIFILLILTLSSTAQISGNQIFDYQQNYGGNSGGTAQQLYLNDSSFLITSSILANVKADSFVATFAICDSAKTLPTVTKQVDLRIDAFIKELRKMGIKKEHIYVDFVTQIPTTDFEQKGGMMVEYMANYQLKKNIMVAFNDIDLIDQMVLKANDQKIYDLVKVDYLVTDLQAVYGRLFKQSMKIINQKKELYILATNQKLSDKSLVFGESFKSFYPENMYSSYTPSTGTGFSSYNNRAYKTLVPRTTHYYKKPSYSGYDKVINPVVNEPMVSFEFKLQIKFDVAE